MSKLHRTAMGRNIDMTAIRTKHEKTRAVGNMSVNAHGDIIDSNNNVITDNSKRVNAMYQKTMDAAARGQARIQQRELDQTSTVTESKSKSVKSKKAQQPELTTEELSSLDEFDQPNPKKE